ncbi:Uncharacterised protein [Serratia quinivorans]|uniref:putative T6SS immunity periplasmic lipoprotein n=1 Tax=Serratia quinivorans TaxID=137545 RepID=UPI00217A87BF|nr:putative T6SS immunity periplasmic lipoprotein [Serratia quinivorans]CAI1495324.1 Uncharacterised protein [Serratia quinivorans]
MKKLFFLNFVFLLTACPGYQDKIVAKIPANVAIKDNDVCIWSHGQKGEKVTAIQIYSEEGGRLVKTFSDNPLYPDDKECLPTFSYKFKLGDNYRIYYDIQASEGKFYQLTASFTLLSDEKGSLHINKDEIK